MTVKYHVNGLWIEKKDDQIIIGLSEKGQDDAGDIMFANLMIDSDYLEAGDTLIGVEGAKAVTDFTTPFAGNVLAIHEAIEEDFDLLNSTDRADNWIVKLRPKDISLFSQLLDKPFPSEDSVE
ncbi:glycine cleavage system protein H [Dolosigranulum pigrum]|uniref:glycine cleavage system protein H n=1 Tax=Dolosigranulum pigrum TaxID=29394 RepID=UPI000DC57E72|nr:glycine cleavage system protein H [Dolosigranulum pigrum]QJS97132.1 glycine cleavage system protein H [Dolosigranulum pigrum]QJS98712.1 glycine cleavage system protein H [Dolosigranulum pigrum]